MYSMDYDTYTQYEVHYLTKKNEFATELETNDDDAEQTLRTLWYEWAQGKPEKEQMRMMGNFYVDVIQTEMLMAIKAEDMVLD